MHLTIDTRHDNGYAVVAPSGEIDLATHKELRETIDALCVADGAHVVVDLSDTEFIDSTGLGALIGGRRKAHTYHGSFSVVCTQEQFLKLFRLTGLDKVFEIHSTVAEATSRPLTAHVLDPADQSA